MKNAWLLGALAAFLVFSSGCLAGVADEKPAGCFIDQANVNSFFLPNFGFAVMAVMFGVSVIYMMSYMFSRPDWRALAKMEFYQLVVGVVLVVIVMNIAFLACNISYGIAGDDPFKVSQKYLVDLISKSLVPLVTDLYRKAFSGMLWANVIIGIFSCSSYVCLAPWAGYAIFASNLETLATMLSPLIASLIFQKLALDFIRDYMFTYFLPLGFVLKVIPFTRDAGAMMIALALGLYVVFPLTFVMDKVVFDYAEAKYDFDKFCDSPGIPSDTGYYVGGFCKPIVKIGKVLPQVVFLPALNLVITITFMRAVQKLLSKDFLEMGEQQQ